MRDKARAHAYYNKLFYQAMVSPVVDGFLRSLGDRSNDLKPMDVEEKSQVCSIFKRCVIDIFKNNSTAQWETWKDQIAWWLAVYTEAYFDSQVSWTEEVEPFEVFAQDETGNVVYSRRKVVVVGQLCYEICCIDKEAKNFLIIGHIPVYVS